jgi:hypothetical protein
MVEELLRGSLWVLVQRQKSLKGLGNLVDPDEELHRKARAIKFANLIGKP